jgi:hypothetical protein
MSAEEVAFAGLADRAEPSPGAEMANGTSPNPSDGADAPVVAHSSPPMNDSGQEPAVPFLQSLVDAMRKIAEQTRDDAMTQLRAGVAERSAGIRSETEQRAAELHELANADLKSVEEWERGETQRIRDEAAVKVSARNATLEAQLAANIAAGEGATTAVEARVDAFEAEMSSFFAQLNDIHDPAALASTLKRIPQPPSLTDVAMPPAGDTAPSPADAVDAKPAKAPDVMGEPKRAPAWTAPRGAAAPQPASDVKEVPEMGPVSEAASPEAKDADTTGAATTDAATTDAATTDAAESASVEREAAAAVEPPVDESTTQVVVTGLTSFGAITSFKQSLERANGISRVSLGLGTSGEFIFTAAHREGFDLSAAIQSFEDSAQFATSNGQLRVTVGAKA